MQKSELEVFLKQYRVPETNGHVLGVFQPGITVYSQQLRSLNILYAMIELEIICKENPIAVIGGGIAGLTFATAALKLGYSVDLFEKSHILIPYQYGCETRRVHPHFYTWPEPLSEYPYCDLPLFNWSHETASTVSKNIYDTYKNVNRLAGKRFNEYRGVKLSSDDIHWGTTETTLEFDSREGQMEKKYRNVIIATGFGIEKRLELTIDTKSKEIVNACMSYWRNDEFEQASLTRDIINTYIISGTGDGAFIDLFRLRLRGFTVKLLLEKLKARTNTFKLLKERLRDIRKKSEERPADEKARPSEFLFTEFDKLKDENLLDDLTTIIKKLLRKDTFIVVHHRTLTVRQLFDLRRASMFNNLVAYTLLSNSFCGFKRVPLDITYAPWSKESMLLSDEETEILRQQEIQNNKQLSELLRSINRKYPDYINEDNVKLILRHGTEIEASLKYIGLAESQINEIKKAQLQDLAINYLAPIWEPGWWNQTLRNSKERIEFVEPELNITCNTFISSLATAIQISIKKTAQFRVVLHRVIRKLDSSFYQQVSHYYGIGPNSRLTGPVARIFPLDVGLVGYSCKTGRSLLLQRNPDDTDYRTTWDALMTKESDRAEKKFSDYQQNRFTDDKLERVDTLFTCPVLYENESGLYPIYCLYIDAEGIDFDEPALLTTIYSMTSGFVKLLDRATHEQNLIESEDLSESLFKIEPTFKTLEMNRVIEESSSLRAVDMFDSYSPNLIFRGFTPHYITMITSK